MKPAARLTDMHTCPLATPGTPPIPHVGGPIMPPCYPPVLIGMLPAARVSDMCLCVGPPDVIVQGSPTVLIGMLPSARIGDLTAHGGVIVTGLPTVLIGDFGGGPGGFGGLGQFAPILSAQAAKRAEEKFENLSLVDKRTLNQALNAAKSDDERAYILKAFAAGHGADDCSAFATKIRGQSKQWMQNNLQLTGNTSGKGVQQQWSHSCNATTVQAVRGQMDPIYALQVHEDNPNFDKVDGSDATKENPNLAQDQQDMLTSQYSGPTAGPHSGVAVGRDQAGGQGRWADDLLNNMQDTTGVEYTTTKDPANPTDLIDNGLDTGAPVPIVIGNGNGQYTHYVLVTGSSDGPPKTYTIHDPWTGNTVTRTEDEVKDGTMNIAGSNQVTAVEVPKPVP